MDKTHLTKEKIIAQAAPIFNQQGYSGTSISAIMAATGLKKGGIYNHFASKDELALAAFDYSINLIKQRYGQILKENSGNATGQLLGIINVLSDNAADSPVPGGCPVLNTAVESDDAHVLLRQRVREVMDEWHEMIGRIVARGIERGQFQPTVDGAALATILIALIEGAVMQSRLYDDPVHVNRAMTYLTDYLQNSVIK
ncbi:MAG TPA: TetR/AcrR family transcriptional regulator [Anaerolineae bacterium]|jgi:AcrR family transcriptional regulator